MEYFAPQVEVLNARVEKGFQMSGDPMATGNGTSEAFTNSGVFTVETISINL